MKVLVVDDEMLARERLVRLLGRLLPDAELFEAADGARAVARAGEIQPELVLLDIRMPGLNGLEVAAEFDQLDNPPAVIFCTAYDEHALQAMEHQAVAYLLKPVRSADLQRALGKAARVNRVQLASLQGADMAPPAVGSGRSQVVSDTHRGVQTMPVVDIRCFLAEQKYVTAYSVSGELLLPDTLKDLQEEFADRFVRVHRNALVALPYIERLVRDDRSGWQVELSGVDLRPAVSRRHLAEVKQRMKQG